MHLTFESSLIHAFVLGTIGLSYGAVHTTSSGAQQFYSVIQWHRDLTQGTG